MLLVVLLGALDHVLTVALAVDNGVPFVEGLLQARVVHASVSIGENTFSLATMLSLELVVVTALVSFAVLVIAQVFV